MPFFCSPQHTLAGTSARGKFPMEGDRISQVTAELTLSTSRKRFRQYAAQLRLYP